MTNQTAIHISEPASELLIILVLIALFSFYRSFYGRKYRPSRVFLRPALYLLFALFLISISFSLLLLTASLLLVVLGAVTGLVLGGSVTFFRKNNLLYYRRSRFVYAIWLVLFILRVAVEIEGLTDFTAIAVVDGLLAFSSGLLLGEAYHIIGMARKAA